MIKTEYGTIHYGGVCKDNYQNIVLFHQNGGQTVKLQKPAMDSFKAASVKVKGIPLTGSWRSCAYQAQLYASDSNRYASPNGTAHTRGLAIDVSTAISFLKKRAIHRALTARGWHQARADEPWHYSFGVNV